MGSMTLKKTMRWLVMILCLLAFYMSNAQDTRFSQYYQAPVYLNPAFAGAAGQARVGANFRSQGTGSQYSFTTTAAYGDYYFKDYYASVGLLFVSEHDEYTGFSKNSIALPFGYDFSINDKITFKPALQVSYTRQAIDRGQLIFSDQIDDDGSVSGGSAESFAVSNQLDYFDFGTGILVFSQAWWIGYSMYNLLQHDISYIEGNATYQSIRYSVHGGVKIPLEGPYKISKIDKTVMPTFHYVSQGPFNQLDAGLLFSIEPMRFGAMYRGVPNPFYDGDYAAISWIVGAEVHDFSFGYSYDMPLGDAISPGGIHELSLSFLFDPTNPHATPRSMKRLECPIPY